MIPEGRRKWQPIGLRRGQLIDGRYELVERLGRGGMGTVWEATHVALGRPVAIKLINSFDDEVATRRFLSEARSAAKVNHPHVVAIHDFGVAEWGAPYMVMERLVGMSLAERLTLKKPRLTVGELLELMCQTLDGLSAVHSAGLIHRDLKPENLFLSTNDAGDQVKLLDFGLTLVQQGVSGHRISQTGAMLGTPAYMSPEQVRRVRDLDVRCDFYNLGVVLYEGLCGELPFGDTSSVEALVHLSKADRPKPLLERRPEIGPALSSFVERAMEPQRSKRFESARDMLAALRQVIEGNDDVLSLPTAVLVKRGANSAINAYVEAVGSSPDRNKSAKKDGRIAIEEPNILVLGRPASSVRNLSTGRGPRIVLASFTALAVLFGASVFALVDNGAEERNGETAVDFVGVNDSDDPPQGLTVSVALAGVPEDATLLVDGHTAKGPSIHLPRDHQNHLLEISAPGFVSWHTQCRADVDTEIRVQLTEAPQPEKSANVKHDERVERRRKIRDLKATTPRIEPTSSAKVASPEPQKSSETTPTTGQSSIIRSPDY